MSSLVDVLIYAETVHQATALMKLDFSPLGSLGIDCMGFDLAISCYMQVYKYTGPTSSLIEWLTTPTIDSG